MSPAFRAPIFVPADRPERFAKASASGADAVILDLEDGVSPQNKSIARESLATSFTELPVVIRINGADTPWYEADIAAVQSLNLAGVMAPKMETPAAVLAHLATSAGRLPLLALVETALGLANAREIARAIPDGRLAFGSVDYAADLGCAHERSALAHARAEVVLASRLGGLPPPLDGVTTRFQDSEAVADDARYGRELGFGGKLCIHPSQPPLVLNAYRPTDAEIAWAVRVLASGEGAANLDGAMIDEPVRKRARQILAAQASP